MRFYENSIKTESRTFRIYDRPSRQTVHGYSTVGIINHTKKSTTIVRLGNTPGRRLLCRKVIDKKTERMRFCRIIKHESSVKSILLKGKTTFKYKIPERLFEYIKYRTKARQIQQKEKKKKKKPNNGRRGEKLQTNLWFWYESNKREKDYTSFYFCELFFFFRYISTYFSRTTVAYLAVLLRSVCNIGFYTHVCPTPRWNFKNRSENRNR